MMQCQICGDTEGPFEIVDHNKRVVLACESCAEFEKKGKIRQTKKTKIRKKENYYRVF